MGTTGRNDRLTSERYVYVFNADGTVTRVFINSSGRIVPSKAYTFKNEQRASDDYDKQAQKRKDDHTLFWNATIEYGEDGFTINGGQKPKRVEVEPYKKRK